MGKNCIHLQNDNSQYHVMCHYEWYSKIGLAVFHGKVCRMFRNFKNFSNLRTNVVPDNIMASLII